MVRGLDGAISRIETDEWGAPRGVGGCKARFAS